MVKFQKQLEAQLVPEWREAYCYYKLLKRKVKRIKEYYKFVDANPSGEKIQTNSFDGILKCLGSPLAALSGRLVKSPRLLWANVDHITVHLRHLGSGGAKSEDEVYETEVLATVTPALEPTQLAADFFKTLDAQLNMVNRFYRLKEEQYSLQAHSLQLEMAALLDARRALNIALCNSISPNIVNPVSGIDRNDSKSGNDSNVLIRSYEADLSLVKSQVQSAENSLRAAEKNMRAAFVQFYGGLGHLKRFSALNMMAFTKILKKYDKVTGWNASLAYCKAVESSYFAGSDKVRQLMDRVEDIFTQHLAKRNYKQAMVYLRPVQRSSEYESLSYFQGFFTGCSVALFATVALRLVLPSTRDREIGRYAVNINVQPLLPVYSTVGLILLHLYMYGWNMYLWRRVHINYTVLFQWTPRAVLRCQEVLLLSSGLTSFWMLLLVILNLYPEAPHADLITLAVLLVIVRFPATTNGLDCRPMQCNILTQGFTL
ncbi:unnamed protein product [Calypogeia fissa]